MKELQKSQQWALGIVLVVGVLAVLLSSVSKEPVKAEGKSQAVRKVEELRAIKAQDDLNLGIAKLELTFGECKAEIEAGREYNCPQDFILSENL